MEAEIFHAERRLRNAIKTARSALLSTDERFVLVSRDVLQTLLSQVPERDQPDLHNIYKQVNR